MSEEADPRPVAPVRAQRKVEVDGIGEVTIRAPGLSVKLFSAGTKSHSTRMGQILADCVLWKDKPLWTAEEWEGWGGLDGNEMRGYELVVAVFDLAKPPEKKT